MLLSSLRTPRIFATLRVAYNVWHGRAAPVSALCLIDLFKLSREKLSTSTCQGVNFVKLVYMQVRMFKSLHDFSFSPNSNLTVLVGPNNVGKSTILQSLRLPTSLPIGRWPFSGRAVDAVTDKRTDAITTLRLEVFFSPSELSRIHPIFQKVVTGRFSFEFSVRSRTKDDFVFLSKIEADHQGGGGRKPIWSARDNTSYVGISVDGDGNITSGANHHLEDDTGTWQKEIIKPFFDDTRRIALDPVRLLLQSLFFYEPHREIAEQTQLSGSSDLEGSGNTLARHLADWQLSQDPRLAAYRELVDALCSGLGTLVTPRVGNTCYVGFRQGSTTINVTEMGTGVQQLLILAYQLVSGKTGLLALEEPEAHLHPSAQRALAAAIRKCSEWAPVIVTTHSPLFVDRQDCRNNHLVALDAAGHTSIRPLSEGDPLRPVRDALGVTIGDSLYSGDVVVLVEGPTEQMVLPILAQHVMRAGKPSIDFNRVMIVNTGGVSNLRALLRIYRGFGVPIIVMIDSDNNALQKLASCVADDLITNENTIVVMRHASEDAKLPAEFEDTLPLGPYLAAVNARYGASITEATYLELEANLKENGRTRSKSRRTDICKKMLVEVKLLTSADDFDKVEVAVTAATSLGESDVPLIFHKLVEKVHRALPR